MLDLVPRQHGYTCCILHQGTFRPTGKRCKAVCAESRPPARVRLCCTASLPHQCPPSLLLPPFAPFASLAHKNI